MSEIPHVKMPDAISPANSGTGEDLLVYEALTSAVEEYKLTNSERAAEFWNSEKGSLKEIAKAKDLAAEYFLRTAEKVVRSNESNRDLWADRFTQATKELFGEPDKVESARLLGNEYRFLNTLHGNEAVSQQYVDFLLSTYGYIISESGISLVEEDNDEQEKEAIQKYGDAMLEKYNPLFDLIDESGKTEFSPKDLKELFDDAIVWLKDNEDSDWGEWATIYTDNTFLAVDVRNRVIKIGSRREVATAIDAKGLIAHELLVHALRGKNGYKTDDKELATGLADRGIAEEGLGILVEEAINGDLPDKAYDRYLDIAIALGSIDGIQRTRQETFDISFARQLIREQFRGTFNEADIPSLKRRVWGHIDRIYRGGPGDSLDTRQAIYTKDIIYYVGYKQMSKYVTEQLTSNRKPSEVLEYLSRGKFDPTKPEHVERLNKSKLITQL